MAVPAEAKTFGRSRHGRRVGWTVCLWALLAGCHGGWQRHHGAAAVWLANPMTVGDVDREFLWNQLVDAVDDYFPIVREDRIRLVGDVLTEGRIETRYVTGSTILEPWRGDSTPGFERRHATLQSIRRKAVVRAWPVQGGYQVEVVVLKELEDVEYPEGAPGGGVVFRNDGTVVRNRPKNQEGPVTLGWIPLGRDLSLEQKILAEFQARLGEGLRDAPVAELGPGRT